VIEVLVKPGDTVEVDQGLVLLESDKATMEVPSSAAGVVKEVRVKEGDSVSEGQVVAVLEAEGEGGSSESDERAGDDGAKPAGGDDGDAGKSDAPARAGGGRSGPGKPPVSTSHRAPAEPEPVKAAPSTGR